jgi:glycosyltransferase involved in cell wall biosynthesis
MIVPVYNEEKILEKNIKKLRDFLNNLEKQFNINFTIVIADNNSIDKTQKIAKKLEKEVSNLIYFRINKKGRGIAIKEAVRKFNNFDYFSFIDCDLPFNLNYLEEFIKRIRECNLVLANRKLINTPITRKITHFGYKILANLILFGWPKIKDFQAGVMFWDKEVNKILIDKVEDSHWFFNTELIYYVIKEKKKICFVNINYEIAKRSSVKVINDSLYFLKKLIVFKLKNIFRFFLKIL